MSVMLTNSSMSPVLSRLSPYANPQDPPQILRFVALVLLAAVPLALLFARGVADVMVSLVALLFLVHEGRNHLCSQLVQSGTAKLLLAFSGWCTLVGLFAYSTPVMATAQGFVLIRYFLFFLAATTWLLTERKALDFVMRIITGLVVIVTIDCYVQFVTGVSLSGNPTLGGRLSSFLHKASIGSYLSKLMFPVWGYWLWRMGEVGASRFRYLALCGVMVLWLCVILLTGERTASALTVLGLGLVFFISALTVRRLRWMMVIGMGSLGSILTAMIAFVPYVQGRFVNFLQDMGDLQGSLYGQLAKASFYSWWEFGPIMGVGIRQFRESCKVFLQRGDVSYCDLHSHNIYLEILSETGAVGLVLFVGVVGSLFGGLYTILRHHQRDHNRHALVVVAFAAAGLFTILCPFSFTMSFVANWSGILNWVGITLSMALAASTIAKPSP